MATNPVFNRIEREAEQGYAGFRDRAPQQQPTTSSSRTSTTSRRRPRCRPGGSLSTTSS